MPDTFDLKTRISLMGDKEYKAAMKDINSQLKLAQSGMKAATSAYEKNDQSVAALTTRQKSLQSVYEAQQQKVEALQGRMEKLRSEDRDNSAEIERMQIALNNATAAMNKTGLEIASTNTALEAATAQESAAGEAADAMADEMAAAQKGAKGEADAAQDAGKKTGEFGEKLGEAAKTAAKVTFEALATSLAAVAAAAGEATKKAFEFAQQAGTYADDVLTLSQQTGISAEQLQKWSYASNFVDTSVETIKGSMKEMIVAMGDSADGSATAQAKFEKLGVSITDSSGNLRDSEDVFWDAIEALGSISNETERDAAAMDLFAESARDLNPLIEAGRDAFDALGAEAESMGAVFSGEALDAMGSFDDSMQKAKAAGEALTNSIGLVVIPAFQPLVDAASQSMGDVATAMQDGLDPGELETLTSDLMTTLGTTVEDVSTMIQDALPMATTALTTIGSTLAEQLPGLLGTLLPAGFTLLQSVIDGIVENTEPLVGLATSLLTNIGTFITENLSELSQAAFDITMGIVDGVTEHLPELIPLAVSMLAELATQLIANLAELTSRLPEICTAIWDGLKEVDWPGLGLNLINGFVKGLSDAVNSLMESIKGVFKTIWQGILDVFGIASPSTEAASAANFILEGLVNGFSEAVDAVCETVKKIFGKIWDAIKSIFGFGGESEESKDAKEAGKDIMSGIKEGVTGSEDEVKAAVKSAAQSVLDMIRTTLGISAKGANSSDTVAYGKGLIEGIRSGIESSNSTGYAGSAGTAAKDVLGAFQSAFDSSDGSSGKFEAIGKAICQGVADGIDKNTSKISTAAKNAAKQAYKDAKSELGISSPSRKMAEVGRWYDLGFAQGIERNMRAVTDAAGAMSAEAAAAVQMPAGRFAAAAAQNSAQAAKGGETGAQTVLNVSYSGPFTRNDARQFGIALAGSLNSAGYALGG